METLGLASAYNGGLLIRKCGKDNTVGSLKREQKSIIVGCLLGDGSVRCKTNALLEINHCVEQRAYVDWKYAKLRSLVSSPPKSRKGNGKRVAYRFTTRSLPQLTEIYRKFYIDGHKVIPKQLLLDPMSLAVWFMNDGSKSYRTVYFNTQKFDLETQENLIVLLKNRFGINLTMNKDKKYFRLRMMVQSVELLKELISSHVIPELLYKLP